MTLSNRIAFVIFVVSLVFSLGTGLRWVWWPPTSEEGTEIIGKTLGTGLMVMVATSIFISVSHSLVRVRADGNSAKPKE